MVNYPIFSMNWATPTSLINGNPAPPLLRLPPLRLNGALSGAQPDLLAVRFHQSRGLCLALSNLLQLT